MLKNNNKVLALFQVILTAIILSLSFNITSLNAQEVVNTAVVPATGEVKPKPPINTMPTKAGMMEKRDIRNERVVERKEIIDQRKDIREEAREKIGGMREDFKNSNKDTRANIEEKRKELKEMGVNPKDIRATTSEMFKAAKDQKREMAKKMKANIFDERKNALVKELNISLTNLTNIKAKVAERIAKLETEGKDVAEAKTLLATVDKKLADAKIAIDSFSSTNFVPQEKAAGDTATNQSQEVDLSKPRQAGDSAIKAVKDVRDTIKKVVELINNLNK